jgi:hypothetical protein
MILWAGKVETESEPEYADMGRRSWRWVLETDVWRRDGRLFGAGIALLQRWRCERDGDEWGGIGCRYYDVSITRYFVLGEEHAYYDGPHCSFSLGWLHFNWSGDWCTKCMPPEKAA